MGNSAKVIAHTRVNGSTDLITLQVHFPWWLLPEMNTHRVFSRNYGSTRAIPIARLIEEAMIDPALPHVWTSHRPGMQGGNDLDETQIEWAKDHYFAARDAAVAAAKGMLAIGIAKQNANRLLMPFIHVEGIITSTEWSNFFDLRCHPDADPTMRALAEAMRDAIAASEPSKSLDGWHLPYIQQSDIDALTSILSNPEHGASHLDHLPMISAARCARVSYLTHSGEKPDIDKDLALARRLLDSKHMSPFEHQAIADPENWNRHQHANFRGWRQHRHMVAA